MPGREVRLVESVQVYTHAGGMLLVQGTEALRIRSADSPVADAVRRLRTGADRDALAGGASAPAVRRLVEHLDTLGWLTAEPPYAEQGVPWDRQVGWLTSVTPDGQRAQDRLRTCSVAVLGVGGIGALAAQHFAGAGVPELWLIDHDEVAVHNLNRQYLFTTADVGEAKVTAAARALRAVNADMRLHTVRRKVVSPEDLDVLPGSLDLLVVAADQPRTVWDTAWAWAERTATPLIGGAVGLGSGYWGPLLDPAAGHCWRCFERRRVSGFSAEERSLENDGTPTAHSFGPTNSLVAALVARDALLFLGTGDCAVRGRRLVLDVLGAGGPVATTGDATCAGKESTLHGTGQDT
ncbi:ThiF family adenylyltransferase [Streptomyces sp. NPDC021356]|uniref:ThiF family adenylyltransferase n=1 Tax=Streptomyces sp. NPDC021356 TaxID=3154900 RepID=UPI0033C45692